MKKTVTVVAFKKNKVLLVEHLDDSDHPNGTCGLPGGRPEGNEEDIDAAKREFKQETGMKVVKEDLEKLPTTYKATISRKNRKSQEMVMEVFYAKKYTGTLKESTETRPKWVLIRQVGSLPLLPNVLNAIKEAFALYC
ncbi:MAG TPA: NUDIX hydrolase [Candidatus Paceibacterota bacterium]|jgi:ADP-ribose pyrophosphatase YjhB (NUDIX family)|nr:NUDIX hydrolase [Candidatus Paceibacterota bacterium]